MHTLHTALCTDADKKSLFNNQELLKFVIISFILVTLMFHSGVNCNCKEKIKCSSLQGLKGLRQFPIVMNGRLVYLGLCFTTLNGRALLNGEHWHLNVTD